MCVCSGDYISLNSPIKITQARAHIHTGRLIVFSFHFTQNNIYPAASCLNNRTVQLLDFRLLYLLIAAAFFAAARCVGGVIRNIIINPHSSSADFFLSDNHSELDNVYATPDIDKKRERKRFQLGKHLMKWLISRLLFIGYFVVVQIQLILENFSIGKQSKGRGKKTTKLIDIYLLEKERWQMDGEKD